MSHSVAAPKVSLGRPRGFDPDAALRAALDVFWHQGYEGTSLDDLNAAMGLSRSSFYACFGSKHRLLMAAVRLYADERFALLTDRAASHRDPREAVHAMLAVIADADGDSRGCLFVNAVSELAPGDEELVAFAQAHIQRVGDLMTETISRLGCTEAQAAQRAGAVLALAMGASTLRKTGVPAPRLTGFLARADDLLPVKPANRRKSP